MADILLHVLATYAFWFIVAQSGLPVWAPLRTKMVMRWPVVGEWALCAMCSGLWCSAALQLGQVLAHGWSIDVVPLTLAGASGCFLIETMVTRLERT